jgi:hypothetical protein
MNITTLLSFHLDDCTAIEIRMAARRAGLPVHEWVLKAIDQALADAPDAWKCDPRRRSR